MPKYSFFIETVYQLAAKLFLKQVFLVLLTPDRIVGEYVVCPKQVFGHVKEWHFGQENNYFRGG